MRLRIAASDVSIVRERPSETTILNVLRATIDAVQPVNAATALIRLGVGNQNLLAQVTNRCAGRLNLRPGDRVFAQIKSVTVRH